MENIYKANWTWGVKKGKAKALRPLWGESVFTGLAPPCNSPFPSHLRKLRSLPSSSSLSVAMAEFLAGCGEPLLNGLPACCSGDAATRKGLAHLRAPQRILVALTSDLGPSLM